MYVIDDDNNKKPLNSRFPIRFQIYYYYLFVQD